MNISPCVKLALVILSRSCWRRRIYEFAGGANAAVKMHRSFAQRTRSGWQRWRRDAEGRSI